MEKDNFIKAFCAALSSNPMAMKLYKAEDKVSKAEFQLERARIKLELEKCRLRIVSIKAKMKSEK